MKIENWNFYENQNLRGFLKIEASEEILRGSKARSFFFNFKDGVFSENSAPCFDKTEVEK